MRNGGRGWPLNSVVRRHSMTVSASADQYQSRISSWDDVAGLIEHFSYYNQHAWLFRGVTNAQHLLIPKIGRELTRGSKKPLSGGERVRIPYRRDDEEAIFSMFQQQARPYLPSPPQTQLEWLAVAQHFGLPTRLLDWTDTLLVALWFAVERGGGGEGDSAIWVTRGVAALGPVHEDSPFGIGFARSYRPPYISPRIAAQGSVFVLCPEPTRPFGLTFVKQITIQPDAEFTIKKRLNTCGINRRYLFPDLGGLGEHLGWLYKNDWLAGYRTECSSGETPTPAREDEGSTE